MRHDECLRRFEIPWWTVSDDLKILNFYRADDPILKE